MIITPLDIYLIGLADNVVDFFSAISAISTIIAFTSVFFFFVTDSYLEENARILMKKILKWCIPIALVFGFLAMVTPSTDTLTKMYVIPTVINSNVFQKLPDELQKYIDKEIGTAKND